MSLPHPELLETLETLGGAADADFELEEAALAAASCERPDLDPKPYRDRFEALATDARARRDDGRTVDAALAEAIAGSGLSGDVETYDDIRNADVAWAFDRGCGLPVTLGVIYLCVARRCDWTAAGLAFPGHFVMGVHGADGAVVVDPFRGGVRRSPEELEALLRVVSGGPAALGPESLRPVSDRMVIDRMLGNLESRLVEPKDVASVAARRRRLSPKNVQLVLHAAQKALDVGWHGEAQAAFSAAMLAAAGDDTLSRKAESGQAAAHRKLN